MYADIKKQWVDALRSGGYEQGTCALNEDNSYCCLGVLCDLHSQATGNEWGSIAAPCRTDLKSYFGDTGGLPRPVREWAGLPDTFGALGTIPGLSEYQPLLGTLASLNDSGFTFEKMAEVIDKHVETIAPVIETDLTDQPLASATGMLPQVNMEAQPCEQLS
jgi:hypothetical protein